MLAYFLSQFSLGILFKSLYLGAVMSTIQKDKKTQEQTLCITRIKWISKWMWLLWLNVFSYSNLIDHSFPD